MDNNTFKTYATKSDFDLDYRFNAEPEGHPTGRPAVRLNYSRVGMMPEMRRRVEAFERVMGWQASGPVMAVVGAGFGWLAEAFEEKGYTKVISIDTSPWIQANKDTTESEEIDEAIRAVGLDPLEGEGLTVKNKLFDGGKRVRASRGVVNERLDTQQSKANIRSLLGLTKNQGIDLVLTEDVLPGLTDEECVQLNTVLKNWIPTVIHYVTTARKGQTEGSHNWKTLEEWKTLLPDSTIIESGTYKKL